MILFLKYLGVLALFAGASWLLNWGMRSPKWKFARLNRFTRQLVINAVIVTGGISITLYFVFLIENKDLRENLLQIFGLIITLGIALSSTTFVANGIAGLMLRSLRNFRNGDWIRVGDQFGRVTERGLFHTEIQTERRDLATLPNLFLITNPVTVVDGEGTIISTELTLGYDIPRTKVEALLKAAAEKAGLSKPYVYVLELGDFSIKYRVGGTLSEVKKLLTARSLLRECIIDTLHAAKVEIVSPTVMLQRRISEEIPILPEENVPPVKPENLANDEVPEDFMFAKADQAEEKEKLEDEKEALLITIKELEEKLAAEEVAERAETEAQLAAHQQRMEEIARLLAGWEEEKQDE